jgi:hypothetical protein
VKEWQDKANAEYRAAKDELSKADSWNLIADAVHAKNAVVDGGIALWDEGRAGAAGLVYLKLETKAYTLKMAALLADGLSHVAAGLAKGAAKAAESLGKLADTAVNAAKSLAAQAAQAAAAAPQYQAEAGALARALTKEVAHKIGKVIRAVGRVVKKAAKKLGRAAVAVGKAAYKYSGAQDVVSCVTNPTLAGCAKAALTVALTVGTAGEGEVAEIGLNAAEHVGEDVAENAGAHTAEDLGEDAATSCGGMSFTASTKVLLASGSAIPISQLKTGMKVLATNTRTGKTRAETISAVMLHHDTNLYDLTIRARGRTAVIHTTSNHPFWDPYLGRWIPASHLKTGEHLKTPNGTLATVDGGATPKDHEGWMWDLTVPGDNDHDFYVILAQPGDRSTHYAGASQTAVLVHNCPVGPRSSGRVLKPGQANDLSKWLGYQRRSEISAGGTRIWEAAKGAIGPRFIAEDIQGDSGGIFKGAKKLEDLYSTGNIRRQGTYGIGDIGNGLFGLVRIGK